MLVINPNANVKLSTILDMMTKNPKFNQYDTLVVVACREKMNTFRTAKTHHYKGTENSKNTQGIENRPTLDNKFIMVRMVLIKNAITRSFELKEYKELDEEITLETGLDEKSSVETQLDFCTDETSRMLREITSNNDKEFFRNEMSSTTSVGVGVLHLVKDLMNKNGYTNLRERRIEISYQDGRSTYYYAVVGTKNGQDFVFDLLAGRSSYYGIENMNIALFLPENKWKDKYDAKFKDKYSDKT
ncbi:hypothetical protein M2407_005168 [Serratia sp. BIGb0234]|uniref:hypothetical protein n=1 Tax=Serratia sp. BIGb0234 TaxID=2940614 RepID=UPI002167C62B|nr:hypothetical protein [Serratia sp. BIGb0234]MCS4320794.1 hypothetical protein [Serratia sp. BIGb0234]